MREDEDEGVEDEGEERMRGSRRARSRYLFSFSCINWCLTAQHGNGVVEPVGEQTSSLARVYSYTKGV